MLRGELADDLAAAAERAGLASARDLLLAEARECAYLFGLGQNTRSAEKLRRRGGSRVGGEPDLPKGAEWPAGLNDAGEPWGRASFLAQFDLAAVPAIEGLALPRRGHLWLFVRSCASDPVIATLFEPDPGALTRRPAPPRKELTGLGALRPTPLRFKRGVSVPYYRESFQKALEAVVGDEPRLISRAVEGLAPANHNGQVGGYSIMPGHDLYREIALRQLGRPDCTAGDHWASLAEYEESLKWERPPCLEERVYDSITRSRAAVRPLVEWIDRHREEIAAEASAWRLLFRFDAGLADLDLGDGISLEVFIRDEDLAAGRFDRLVGEYPMIG